jgi:hypothetical protein
MNIPLLDAESVEKSNSFSTAFLIEVSLSYETCGIAFGTNKTWAMA